MSDVEFASVVEEWPLDVLLEDEGFHAAIDMLASLLYYAFYLLQSKADVDAIPSIGQFSRFDNPNIIKPHNLTLLPSFIKSFQKSNKLLII